MHISVLCHFLNQNWLGHVSNGVKQGGCISPTFFSVYLNGLIEKLRKNDIGCRYGSDFMGVFCYADDLILLCPSFTDIKERLRTCEIYANKHKILFNAKKSQLLHFTKSSTSKDPQLFMKDGSIIPYVNTCNHLGNTISIKSDKVILDNAVNKLYMRTNCLLSDFLFSECSTLSHLFNTYCKTICNSEKFSLQRYIFDDKYEKQCKIKLKTIQRSGVVDSISNFLRNYNCDSKRLVNLLLKLY